MFRSTHSPTLISPTPLAPSARATVLGCVIALAVALGVGRFAFTPLLPLMLSSGSLDIRQGGWLASANYAGYLLGAVTCAAIRIEHGRMVKIGLASTVCLTLAMGLTNTFWLWASIRFVAGVVSAWAFVFASQWGLKRLNELHASGLSGAMYAGPGIGILTTGLLGAAAAHFRVAPGQVWIGFAICSCIAAAVAWKHFSFIRPNDAARNDSIKSGTHTSARTDSAWLIALYGMAGFGYIITATFLPVIARHALPDSVWPDLFWPVFGLALVIGALSAARLPGYWDNRLLLAGCYLVQAIGIVLSIVFPNVLGFAMGSVLLGLPFTAITFFGMREARRLHGDRAAGLMGYATAAYGLGQIAGPLIAAPIASHTGSFSLGLWIAAAALSAGAAKLAHLGLRAVRIHEDDNHDNRDKHIA